MDAHDVKIADIFEYRMDEDEAQTFKLALIYEKEFIKMFGGTDDIDGEVFRRNTLPKRRDPRKSHLFRQCWKMRRETRGLLESDQYIPYMKANLTILKINHQHGHKKGHVRLDPACICGDQAWARWKLHERWTREKNDELASEAPRPSKGSDQKICTAFDKTKKFLFERCEGDVTYEKIQNFVDKGFFKFWVATGKVSPYYVVLSPFVEKSCDIAKLSEDCNFDPRLMLERISDGVRTYFKAEYAHEFGSGSGEVEH